MPGFSVTEFTGRLGRLGLASPNKFKVQFENIPVTDSNSVLNFMCESVDLAGRQVQSTMENQYGLRREIAYNAPTYNPVSITFLCTENMDEKRILDKWNNICVDANNKFDVGYYKDYASGKMRVTTLDSSGTVEKYWIEYQEVWPKSVQSVNMSHATQNNTLRVVAEFSYAYWITQDTHSASNTALNDQYSTTGGDPYLYE